MSVDTNPAACVIHPLTSNGQFGVLFIHGCARRQRSSVRPIGGWPVSRSTLSELRRVPWHYDIRGLMMTSGPLDTASLKIDLGARALDL
jgi:hypothetical protein